MLGGTMIECAAELHVATRQCVVPIYEDCLM